MSMKTVWILRISAIAGAALLVWFFFFSQWSSCSRQEVPEIEFAKRDSTLELQVTSYKKQITDYKLQIERLEDSLRFIEQSRHEIIVNAKTKNTIAEMQSSSELYKQSRLWLSGTRPLNLKPRYEFDSLDVLSLIKKKNENEFLNEDNKLLNDKVTILNSQIKNYKWQVSDLNRIISFKDDQIDKLESVPRITISKRKWHTDAMIITGAAAFGFTAGIIYKNLSK